MSSNFRFIVMKTRKTTRKIITDDLSVNYCFLLPYIIYVTLDEGVLTD